MALRYAALQVVFGLLSIGLVLIFAETTLERVDWLGPELVALAYGAELLAGFAVALNDAPLALLAWDLAAPVVHFEQAMTLPQYLGVGVVLIGKSLVSFNKAVRVVANRRRALGLHLEPAGLVLRLPEYHPLAPLDRLYEERLDYDAVAGWSDGAEQLRVIVDHMGAPPIIGQILRSRACRPQWEGYATLHISDSGFFGAPGRTRAVAAVLRAAVPQKETAK